MQADEEINLKIIISRTVCRVQVDFKEGKMYVYFIFSGKQIHDKPSEPKAVFGCSKNHDPAAPERATIKLKCRTMLEYEFRRWIITIFESKCHVNGNQIQFRSHNRQTNKTQPSKIYRYSNRPTVSRRSYWVRLWGRIILRMSWMYEKILLNCHVRSNANNITMDESNESRFAHTFWYTLLWIRFA